MKSRHEKEDKRKLNAIRGALAGRHINVLITDHISAIELMKS